MTKELYFIQLKGNPMNHKAMIGLYSGPTDSGQKVAKPLGTPFIRRSFLEATSAEDLEARLNSAESFMAMEINKLLPEGKSGSYYGISYDKAKEHFAKYGIVVLKA